MGEAKELSIRQAAEEASTCFVCGNKATRSCDRCGTPFCDDCWSDEDSEICEACWEHSINQDGG